MLAGILLHIIELKTTYSGTSLISLNGETWKIYEVPITGQNPPERANCRDHDTPSLVTMNQPAAPP